MEIIISCSVMLVGVVYSYCTVSVSGIGEHAFGEICSGVLRATGSGNGEPRRARLDEIIAAWRTLRAAA